jgi:ribosomal protein S18 acetylase RimI-like enzyme
MDSVDKMPKNKSENITVDDLKIINITRDYYIRNRDRFFELENNWSETGQPSWNDENFLLELPLKWELSFAIEYGGSIITYIVGSQDSNNKSLSKVNKIVVDSAYQRRGIGRKLMEKYFEASVERGMKEFELKAMVDYAPANELYISLGYQLVGTVKGTDEKFRNVYRKRLE